MWYQRRSILETDEECEECEDESLLEKLFETSEKSVERKICECKKAFREELGREPTEKEIESWLLFDR